MPFFCIHCRSEIDPKFKACPFCGEAITDFLRRFSDAPIDGKYQLISRLGVGGMGEVYKALHLHLNAIRVIKVMHPNITREEGAHERFLREARLATKIHHPNVATLFDFSTLDDGSWYMVWEYIEGTNLHELIDSHGPLSPRYAATLAVQALHGLEAIHRAGIVHRDVSPENLMISRGDDGEERVKIIDLGIAKQAGADGDDKTKTGMFVGKWKYCSPEHLGMLPEGERIDGRADLYSFGIVLYEMLSGVPPFQADTPHSYLMMHASERPKALRDVNPSVAAAPELEDLIFRALEKDRKKRFESARDFARAIEGIKASLPETPGEPPPLPRSAEVTAEPTRATGDLPTVVNAPVSTTIRTEAIASTVVTSVVSSPRRPKGAVAAAVAVIVVATGLVMWRGHSSSAPPTKQPPVSASVLHPAQKATLSAPEVSTAPTTSVAVTEKRAAQGHLGINAFPWAEVTKIRNVGSGEDVELNAPLVTPVPIDLAAGRYEITFSNPSFGRSIRKSIDIVAGKEHVVSVTFADATTATLPRFDEVAQ